MRESGIIDALPNFVGDCAMPRTLTITSNATARPARPSDAGVIVVASWMIIIQALDRGVSPDRASRSAFE